MEIRESMCCGHQGLASLLHMAFVRGIIDLKCW